MSLVITVTTRLLLSPADNFKLTSSRNKLSLGSGASGNKDDRPSQAISPKTLRTTTQTFKQRGIRISLSNSSLKKGVLDECYILICSFPDFL